MPDVNKKRDPRRDKKRRLLRKWKQYLSNSRLTKDEVESRARHYAKSGKFPGGK